MKCKICGSLNCKTHALPLGKTISIDSFSGSSPPEIFVGRYNYPNINIGILSPNSFGKTNILSSHELWHSNKLQIPQILSLRNQLIYGRTKGNIKFQTSSYYAKKSKKFFSVFQEIAKTHKSTSTSFTLSSKLKKNNEKDTRVPLIKNAADTSSVSLLENPQIKKKVEYLTSDSDALSKTAILELDKAKIQSSNIMKLLSSGLLGRKKNRILVPTRWSITAVDSILSSEKMKTIKTFQEISDFQVFHSYYLGNNYFFLLLPSHWQFEVIEFSLKSYEFWHDHESFFKRKNYADSVTGAYYANRLALTEYLQKIKRQASCLVFREIRPEYYAPLGVGILRETSRAAFSSLPKRFNTLQESLSYIQQNIKVPITKFTEKSILLKNFKQQAKIQQFF